MLRAFVKNLHNTCTTPCNVRWVIYTDMLLLCTTELDDERQLSVTTRLACGALAGTTGQTVAYPLDVVRRRLQVTSPPCPAPPRPPFHPHVLPCLAFT